MDVSGDEGESMGGEPHHSTFYSSTIPSAAAAAAAAAYSLFCMMAKGGTSRPACAACKHQRRKCTADCPLALYFPADQPKQFQNAHRLFGVSNILRILKDLDPSRSPRP
uniref:LOB domain-containing protein n=1 Tax=Ananas comosus var. bracteatus TaxID=296719 RepID=A0A6V7NID3_ANACO|nr:unnamed protein product [Ananas comosus var. bracteatus]